MKKLFLICCVAIASAAFFACNDSGGDNDPVYYTVTFNSQGGTAVSPKTVEAGSSVSAPTPPTKSSSVFIGWYKEAAGTNVWSFATDKVNNNITLYAKWQNEVSLSDLQSLVDEFDALTSTSYTATSWALASIAANAAEGMIMSGSATATEIATAFSALRSAIDGLVDAAPTTSLEIEPMPMNGVIFLNPGEYFTLRAHGVDASGNYSVNDAVQFSYSSSELEAFSEFGNIYTYEYELWFPVKEGLVAGSTVEVTITSVDVPTVSKTVTLKVAAAGETLQQFLDLVNALPDPAEITSDDYDAIQAAWAAYDNLSGNDWGDPAVEAAVDKLNECDDAYYDLPVVVTVSYSGTTSTWSISGESVLEYAYEQNGAIPNGTYTADEWYEEWYGGAVEYTQERLVLTPDLEFKLEYRKADNAAGLNPSDWTYDEEGGTYTYEVTSPTTGILNVTMDRSVSVDPEPGEGGGGGPVPPAVID